MATDHTTIMSGRVADTRPRYIAPGSSQLACAICGEMVWVSQELLQHLAGRDFSAMCDLCFKDAPKLWNSLPTLSPAQRDWLKKAHGVNDDELDGLLDEVMNDLKYG